MCLLNKIHLVLIFKNNIYIVSLILRLSEKMNDLLLFEKFLLTSCFYGPSCYTLHIGFAKKKYIGITYSYETEIISWTVLRECFKT